MSAERCLSCNPYFAICNYPYVRNTFKKGMLDDLLIFILLGGGGRDLWDVSLEVSAVLNVLLGSCVPEMRVRDSTQVFLPPWYLPIA